MSEKEEMQNWLDKFYDCYFVHIGRKKYQIAKDAKKAIRSLIENMDKEVSRLGLEIEDEKKE